MNHAGLTTTVTGPTKRGPSPAPRDQKLDLVESVNGATLTMASPSPGRAHRRWLAG